MDSLLVAGKLSAKRTKDVDLIDHITRECLPGMRCDQHNEVIPAAGLVDNPSVTFIEVDLDDQPKGILAMVGNEVHTMFLKPLRGRLAIKAMRTALDWVWGNTDFREVTSYSYSHRPDAAWFARAAGFIETNKENDGVTVDGKPVTRTNYYYKCPGY